MKHENLVHVNYFYLKECKHSQWLKSVNVYIYILVLYTVHEGWSTRDKHDKWGVRDHVSRGSLLAEAKET